jgi:transposase
MDQYLEAQELARQGITKTEIGIRLSMDRKTVRKYLKVGSQPPMKKERRDKGNLIQPFAEYIRLRVAQGCTNAVVLLREIKERGYEGGYSTLKEFLVPLRQEQKWRAEIRWEAPPGLYAQVDWGYFTARLPDGTRMKLYAFVFTLAYSRVMYVEWTTGMDLATFERCHEHAFDYVGGVPKYIVYDRMKTVVLGEDERGEVRFHPAFTDFAACYGFTPRATPPNWPRGKGKVERGVRYVRQNFWPGLVAISGVNDLNDRCREWLDQVANRRVHGTTGRIPFEMLTEEELQPLSNKGPDPVYPAVLRTVTRDCLVSYRGSQYTVPSEWANKQVWVRPVSNERIVVSAGGKVISEQALEPVLKRTVINDAHYAPLRGRSRPKLVRHEPLIRPPSLEVERRPLT